MVKFNPYLDITDLVGKVILVTGGGLRRTLTLSDRLPGADRQTLNFTGTAGLGSEIVTQLVAHHPKAIYFTGRNESAAHSLLAKLAVTSNSSNTPVALHFLRMDQSSLQDVSATAAHLLQRETRLDILICNAGVLHTEVDDGPGTTQDGYELHMGVNHLSHALLIKKLRPLLLRTQPEPGRVVVVASTGFRASPLGSGIVFDQLKSSQKDFGPWLNWTGLQVWFKYGQSKLANVLYVQELARHHPDLLSVAVHPGVFDTYLTTHVSWFHRAFLTITTIGDWYSVPQAAHNPLWAATTDKGNLKNGYMYFPVGQTDLGFPRGGLVKDKSLAKRLWDWTERELAEV